MRNAPDTVTVPRMVCPACDATNPDDARYCNQCGASVVTRVPRPTELGVPRVMVPPIATSGPAIGPPPIVSAPPGPPDNGIDATTLPTVDTVSLSFRGLSPWVLAGAGIVAVVFGIVLGAILALRGSHAHPRTVTPVGLLGVPAEPPVSDAGLSTGYATDAPVGNPTDVLPAVTSPRGSTVADAGTVSVRPPTVVHPPAGRASGTGPRAGDETEVAGRMDPRVFGFVYQHYVPQVTACYVNATRTREVSGVILLRVRIGTDGRVTRTRALSDTTGSQQLSTCVQNVVHGWRFPPPQGGVVDVDYPLRFGGG